jgi:hypothetical protein
MWETRSVQLSVRLPRDIAVQAEEVQLTDPDFLSRVVLYGLTRRSIYRHLRDGDPGLTVEPPSDAGAKRNALARWAGSDCLQLDRGRGARGTALLTRGARRSARLRRGFRVLERRVPNLGTGFAGGRSV